MQIHHYTVNLYVSGYKLTNSYKHFQIMLWLQQYDLRGHKSQKVPFHGLVWCPVLFWLLSFVWFMWCSMKYKKISMWFYKFVSSFRGLDDVIQWCLTHSFLMFVLVMYLSLDRHYIEIFPLVYSGSAQINQTCHFHSYCSSACKTQNPYLLERSCVSARITL